MHAVSKGGTRVVEDTETAAAALDASCLAGPDPTAAQSQIQDRSKGQRSTSFVFVSKIKNVCLNVLTLHTLKKLNVKNTPAIKVMCVILITFGGK